MTFSCVMITTKSRAWIVPEAVRCFQAQTCPATERELVIVCPVSHTSIIRAVVPHEDNIRIEGIAPVYTEGGRRNAAIARCDGRWIVTWDDDDWVEPRRLEKIQTAFTADPSTEMIGSLSMHIHELRTKKSWKYTYKGPEKYLIGGTLAMTKAFSREHLYPLETGVHEHQTGSDAALVVPALASGTPYVVIDSDYVALVHGGNIANPEIPHYLNDPFYTPLTPGSDYIDHITNGWASRATVAHATRAV